MRVERPKEPLLASFTGLRMRTDKNGAWVRVQDFNAWREYALVLESKVRGIEKQSAVQRNGGEMKWISVEERPPEVIGAVWGYNADSEQQDKFWFDPDSGRFTSMHSETVRNVTHWMPLPNPPSKGEQ